MGCLENLLVLSSNLDCVTLCRWWVGKVVRWWVGKVVRWWVGKMGVFGGGQQWGNLL